MIQRIQTVYLLIIAGLMLAILFLPLTEITMSVFYGVIGVLSLGTVFCYNNRKLQIKLCYLILALLVLSFIAMYFIVWAPNQEAMQGTLPMLWIGIPAIAVILNLLAIRGISKDDKLVRSLDRLR